MVYHKLNIIHIFGAISVTFLLMKTADGLYAETFACILFLLSILLFLQFINAF